MKVFTGKVISIKMAKTATVEVVRNVAHPIYGKRIKRTKKYHTHDELGAKVGNTVKFVACRPVSKLKKWKVIEIVGAKKGKK
ncbi:30S ribosomal protein S17 [Candidatus Woesebacteria bacterium RIFCSPHIGHO2_01_FULL_44_21]|uniref:Small ribosomal subunit protein uS17 n=1 Tax=Candidatus Woesebacteria bacterium RIFCSPHIGHO2_01_FULL_44_21 TaxID=1802503 RepID=A0A1F7Z1E4_9BACT|nr:MAG: 30S ribosomal protein S17 [Candidatus Woesebacteria bacterium RIFCSPHIGHO2_01_FULL_44_21]OGM71479.1 MAG: 30S ribosomal protein S17 [Candidatus Woesebacteria bacterium RIFCSPLOWO2_01_FULL_44_24b]